MFTENDRWLTDEEFGREFLCGVNPVMVRRCSEPLDKFPVTEEMVGNLLDRGQSLKEEMQVNRTKMTKQSPDICYLNGRVCHVTGL